MELDPTLHTKLTDVQLQTLTIVDAFHYLSPLPQRSYLVIIDGLDECRHDMATQRSILQLVCETITVYKLPLRFIKESRLTEMNRIYWSASSNLLGSSLYILDDYLSGFFAGQRPFSALWIQCFDLQSYVSA